MIFMNYEKIRDLYGKVGLVVGLSQMIEYNLANVVSLSKVLSLFNNDKSVSLLEYNDVAKESNELYEKMIKNPLGYTISEAKKVPSFSKKFIDELEKVLNGRNWIVHHLFADDIFDHKLEKEIDSVIAKIDQLTGLMNEVNEDLCNVLKYQHSEIKDINV